MTQTPSSPPLLAGLSAIADRFDAAILDQWGVLHDGAKAPPGAIDAVNAMAAAGKRLAVLSNSARLGGDAKGRLTSLGYDIGTFAGIVTSGETARDMLRDRADPFFAGPGRKVLRRVLLIARDGTLLENLGYETATEPEAADFVLLGSSTAPEKSLTGDYAELLARAARFGLPMLCANPDRVGVAATGLIEGPGLLAAYYESQGGIVRYIGKPHPEVYGRCRALLGDIPASRILCIGDSLEHDIAGGHQAGCLTAFIQAGIHAADLRAPGGLERLYGQYGVTPDFRMERLVW
jgi:HAD superfamily hydrolase (TIGR01459 family)